MHITPGPISLLPRHTLPPEKCYTLDHQPSRRGEFLMPTNYTTGAASLPRQPLSRNLTELR